jgi:predicted NodU family carbamoyl transferase
MIYTLGINCSGFHSSACLLGDGAILAAICEERLSRVKYDKSFPHRAIDYCCRTAGIEFHEIRDVFVGWNPRHYLRRSDGALGDALRSRGKMSYLALNELATHLPSELLDVEQVLRSMPVAEVYFASNHFAHAEETQSAIKVCEKFGVPFATPAIESRISPDTTLPSMVATGIAIMNQATTRARTAAGNQAVRE